MNTEKKGISTYDIVAIALMAAFVFVATYFFKNRPAHHRR